jgi:hypothetical protein
LQADAEVSVLSTNDCVNAVGAFDIGFRIRVIAHSRSTPCYDRHHLSDGDVMPFIRYGFAPLSSDKSEARVE